MNRRPKSKPTLPVGRKSPKRPISCSVLKLTELPTIALVRSPILFPKAVGIGRILVLNNRYLGLGDNSAPLATLHFTTPSTIGIPAIEGDLK